MGSDCNGDKCNEIGMLLVSIHDGDVFEQCRRAVIELLASDEQGGTRAGDAENGAQRQN